MKFILVLVLMLSTTFGAVITLDNIQEFLPAEHEAVAEYVSENINLFKDKWNETSDSDGAKFNGSSIECSRVLPLQDGGDVTYLDFDGDNGYLVLADKYTLLSFEIVGDLPWVRTAEDAYFSQYSGIYTKQADSDEYLSNSDAAAKYAGTEDIEATLGILGQSAEGANGGGYSRIYAPLAYVKDRTGKYDWNYQRCNSIANYNSYDTGDMFNFFLKREANGRIVGEGNCSVVATYNVLTHYNRVRLNNRVNTKSLVYHDPTLTDGDGNYSQLHGFSVIPTAVPKLYADLRFYASVFSGYSALGMPDALYSSMARPMSLLLGHLVVIDTAKVNVDTIIRNVDRGIVTVLAWNDIRSIGGAHAGTIVDYTITSRTTGWWIFKSTQTRVFLGGADGQARIVPSKLRWIDWTGYSAISSYGMMWSIKLA